MRPAVIRSVLLAAAAMAVLAAAACMIHFFHVSPAGMPQTVVVYTSLDQDMSEPILRRFEERTGVRVLPVYDAEAAKTTTLVNRLISRRDNPDCDVLWNSEVVQTQHLAEMDLLEPYTSPQAARIPPQFRDPNARWTGFAARARVVVYNTTLVSRADAPTSIADFADPKWRGRAVIARPFFGSTLTHMAALYQLWGAQRLGDFLQRLRDNDVAICPGNAAVRDMVATGERAIGVTDTDDAFRAIDEGKPLALAPWGDANAVIFFPNAVSIIRGCPHPSAARQLVDFLLSAEVEEMLAKPPGTMIPVAADLAQCPTPWRGKLPAPAMNFDVPRAAHSLPAVRDLLQQKGMDR